MWRLQIAQRFETTRKKSVCALGEYLSHWNFKGSIRTYTFCVTNFRVNIIVFLFFVLSLIQCQCGLNWLWVHHLTISEGACPPPSQVRLFSHTSKNQIFVFVLVEDCRVLLLFASFRPRYFYTIKCGDRKIR